jgi:hypothetical protein
MSDHNHPTPKSGIPPPPLPIFISRIPLTTYKVVNFMPPGVYFSIQLDRKANPNILNQFGLAWRNKEAFVIRLEYKKGELIPLGSPFSALSFKCKRRGP